MTKTNKANLLSSYLDEILPNAKCELLYSKDYELVIAVMLSAQTTDKAVNNITKKLFSKYPTLETLNNVSLLEIESIIMPLGLYKNKALNIKKITEKLINEFHGILPSDKKLLMTFPGVGNKTAGVIRAEIFKMPDLPVDTHILRISRRLGFSNLKDKPIDVETKLKNLFPENKWIKIHHQLIHFGRYYCKAKNPLCQECKLREICKNS